MPRDNLTKRAPRQRTCCVPTIVLQVRASDGAEPAARAGGPNCRQEFPRVVVAESARRRGTAQKIGPAAVLPAWLDALQLIQSKFARVSTRSTCFGRSCWSLGSRVRTCCGFPPRTSGGGSPRRQRGRADRSSNTEVCLRSGVESQRHPSHSRSTRRRHSKHHETAAKHDTLMNYSKQFNISRSVTLNR